MYQQKIGNKVINIQQLKNIGSGGQKQVTRLVKLESDMNKPSTVLAHEDAMWYVQHVSVRRVMLCAAADRHPVTPIPVMECIMHRLQHDWLQVILLDMHIFIQMVHL